VGQIDSNPAAIDAEEVESFVASGDVDWVGGVPDVRPYLQRASVFVLPSYREGVPRSTLEAMACGLAIVTTDAPGCRDTVIDGENGVLVEVGNVESLVSALLSFCEDPMRAKLMGASSRSLALGRFSADHVNEKIVQILRSSEVE
jgi:glycosyltransferase involved in cell wall biosynthesis